MTLSKSYVIVELQFIIRLLCAGFTIMVRYSSYCGGNSDAHIVRVGELMRPISESKVVGVISIVPLIVMD